MTRLLLLFAASLALAPAAAAAGDPARGRDLFRTECASCHGLDARGVDGRGPSLHGAGGAAADFYLSTGRMPIDVSQGQPDRSEPAYDRRTIADLVAYVASLGGPPVPDVDVAAGDLAEGRELFTRNCAACHQVLARGGVVAPGYAPTLLDSTPRQVAEAVRIKPYLMSRFSDTQLDDREIASIARYVEYAKHPQNPGGWPLFDIGPVPEGMVAWLVGLGFLLVVIRLLGDRMRR